MFWVLIRSTLLRGFFRVQKNVFLWRNRKKYRYILIEKSILSRDTCCKHQIVRNFVEILGHLPYLSGYTLYKNCGFFSFLTKYCFIQVVSGGVACNQYFRQGLQTVCDEFDCEMICPPPHLCTDNGIMIAWWDSLCVKGLFWLCLSFLGLGDILFLPRLSVCHPSLCPLCNLKTIQDIFMKHHRNINQHWHRNWNMYFSSTLGRAYPTEGLSSILSWACMFANNFSVSHLLWNHWSDVFETCWGCSPSDLLLLSQIWVWSINKYGCCWPSWNFFFFFLSHLLRKWWRNFVKILHMDFSQPVDVSPRKHFLSGD